MSDVIEYYHSKEELNSLEEKWHAKGFCIRNIDHIDERGNITNGESGKLTIVSDTSNDRPQTREQVLMNKLGFDTITATELRELLRMKL